MSRYIDAEKIIDAVLRHYTDAERSGQFNFSPSEIKQNFADTIENIPTADVKPIVYAELRIVGDTTMHYECSQCGEAVDKWDNYCKHCGADMRKESEEE